MSETGDQIQQDYTDKIQVGVSGHIVINAGMHKGRYSTSVEAVGDDAVGFSYPVMKERLLPIYKDMEFEFVMEDGSALYVFQMSVKRVERQGSSSTMWARRLDNPDRIQRREFLRVGCRWDIMIFHLGYETNKPMFSRWRPAKAIDISRGGYCFKLNMIDADGLTFATGDSILMFFTLSDKQYMLSGKGTRIVRNKDAWEVGVGFDSVPASLEKKLYEFIRQQELRLRDE